MADLKAMLSGLNRLDDAGLKRLVAVVDGLKRRGPFDHLLDPLRGRLATIRPPRPVTLDRLMFNALDPLIVPPESWQRDGIAIPRPALTPLRTLILTAMGAKAEALRARLAARRAEDRAELRAISTLLWQAAADALREAKPPEEWRAGDLPDFAALARDIGFLFSIGIRVETLSEQAQLPGGVEESVLLELLTAAARVSENCFGMLTMILMGRVAAMEAILRAARVVGATSGRLGADGPSLDQAVDKLALTAETTVAGDAPMGALTDSLEDFQHQIAAAEEKERSASAARLRRMDSLRTAIELTARARFARTLEQDVMVPLLHRDDGAPLSPAELEEKLRELRRLGEVAGTMGDPRTYAGMRSQAAALISAMDDKTGVALVTRVRMVELLTDSNNAMSLLQNQSSLEDMRKKLQSRIKGAAPQKKA